MKSLQFFLLLALIITAGYWITLQIYPASGDWDIFFNILHPNANIWNFTPYDLQNSVWRHFTFPINILFPVFKFNFSVYFLVGLITYFLSAIIFYLFLLEVTKNKYLSTTITILFVSLGYYSWESLKFLSYSHQMFGALLFTFLILFILTKHIKEKKLWQYLLALFLFAFSLEFYVIRANAILPVLITSVLLFSKPRSLLIFGLKLLPFIFIYKLQYSHSFISINEALSIFKNNPWELMFFMNFPATFNNLLVPSGIFTIFQKFPNLFSSNKFLASISFDNLQISWALSGTLVILFLLYLVKKYWRENIISKLLLFSIIWFFFQYLPDFLAYADDNFRQSLFETGSRYFPPQLVTVSIIFGSLIFMLSKKFQKYVLVIVVIAAITSANFKFAEIVNNSKIVKKIHEEIKSQTDILPEKPIIFIDYSADLPDILKNRYEHPNNGFAVFRDFGKTVREVNSFEELKTADINNVLTFYVDSSGVRNTTLETKRKLISNEYLKKSSVKKLCDAEIKQSWEDKTNLKYFNTPGTTAEWPSNLWFWIANHREEVDIDQKEEKLINKIVWTNHLKQTTPADYEYLVSRN